MAAVLLRARAEYRARWRSWLGLGLLVGLVAGLVIAAAAGARRTAGAYERFLAEQRAADVFVDNFPDPGVGTVDADRVERLPQVESAARVAFLFVAETGAIAPADARFGREVGRLKLVDGRLPDQDRLNEIAVGFERIDELGWRIGTEVPLIEPRYAKDAADAGVRNRRLRVVGTVATPEEFPPLVTGAPSIYLTRAFHRAYANTALFEGGAGDAVLARLKRGAADVSAFRAAVAGLSEGRPNAVHAQHEHTANVERSLHLQATALWLLAAALAATGLMVLSQALARHARLEAADHGTLRALGMTRRQLLAVGLVRAVAVGVVGAATALGLATALSPLAPLGHLARTAEPDLGVNVDATAFALGAAATVLLVVVVSMGAGWLVARTGREGTAVRQPLGSRLADRLAGWGAAAPVVTGVRMAFDPGRGNRAVPTRSGIAAVAGGVMACAAALTFSASSTHLLDTPRLYGWNWDMAVTNYNSGDDLSRVGAASFGRDRAIEEYSTGDLGLPLDVDGKRVDGIALVRGRGNVLPPVIDGRAPTAPGEVMLGAKTMRSLDIGLGDDVSVRRPGARSRRMRVVGRGVLAAGFSGTARLGEGAVIHERDARRLAPGTPAGDALLRLAPGTDRRALLARLIRRTDQLYDRPRQPPLDIVDFGRVRGLPLLLAGVLGLMAAATLVHVLLSSVRRRRRDLAVLKTLGFARRQVRGVVLTQSLTYALTAVLVGLPLGVAVGRFAWNVYAERQGIVAEVIVPLPAVLLVLPAAALLAVAIAWLPARAAASTHPAAVLREE